MGWACTATGCGGEAFIQNSPGADAAPDAVVEAGADALPEAMAEASIDAPAEATADVVGDAITEVAPDVAGDVVGPDVVPDVVPDVMPDVGPDVMPDVVPDVLTPDAGPVCKDVTVPISDCTNNGLCAVQGFVGQQSPIAYKFSLVIGGQDLYWAEQDNYNGIGTGAIKRLSINAAGGTPETFSTTQPRPFSVTVDDQYVYWLTHAHEKADAGGTNGPRLWGAKRDCAVPCQGQLIKEYPQWSPSSVKRVGADRIFVLFKEQVSVLEGSGLAWNQTTTHTSGEYPSMALGFDGVYTSTVREPQIHRLSLDGTLNTPFASFLGGNDAGEPGTTALASTCSSLYALAHDQSLWAIENSTGQKQLVTGLGNSLWGMAADEKFVYVHRANAGGVTRVDRTTGARKELAQGNVFTLAVGPKYVYFDDHGTGEIKRIVK